VELRGGVYLSEVITTASLDLDVAGASLVARGSGVPEPREID